MSFINGTGFELGGDITKAEFSSISSVNVPTIVGSGQQRSGNYALKVDMTGHGTEKCGVGLEGIATLGVTNFASVHFKVETAPASETRIAIVSNVNDVNTAGGVNSLIYVTLDQNRILRLYDEDGQITGNSPAISLNDYHTLDLEYLRTTGSNNHVVKARLDGVQFAGSSTRNVGAALSNFHFGGNLNNEANAAGVIYFDDVIMNDNQGTSVNTVPPILGHIVHSLPDAFGDNNAWTPVDSGVVGSPGVNNYQRVDDLPLDDATSYLRRTTTGSKIDEYNIQVPQIPTSNVTIILVAVGARVGSTSTSSSGRTGTLILKSQAGGTRATATFGWNVNGWATHGVASPKTYQLVRTTNPQNSLAWNQNDFPNMQIGFQNGTSSSNEIRITSLWGFFYFTAPDTFVRTHTTNSLLRTSYTKTHTTNALKRVTNTRSHTTNANRKNAFTRTHTTDARGFRSPTKTHTTDALKKSAPTKTHTTNALKKGTLTKIHTTNALKKISPTKTHTTDALLDSRLHTLTIEHTTDFLARKVNTVSHGTYSTLKFTKQTLSTTDALLRVEVTKTHTTNSFRKFLVTVTHTTDALLVRIFFRIHTTSSVIRRESTKTHTTNSFLYQLQTLAVVHTTNASLASFYFGDWSETWDYTIVDFIRIHTTNALKKAGHTISHTVDALIKLANLVMHTTDANLERTALVVTHTTNATLRKETVSHTTDAYLFGKWHRHRPEDDDQGEDDWDEENEDAGAWTKETDTAHTWIVDSDS